MNVITILNVHCFMLTQQQFEWQVNKKDFQESVHHSDNVQIYGM